MKSVSVLMAILWLSLTGFAQSYNPVDNGSSVKFRIKNFGFNVTGTLSGLKGSIKFDPASLTSSSFDVSIDVNSINTGIDSRDNHLRKTEYLDVKNYPRIKFVSTKITPSSKNGTLFVFGKLTIKNVTREISFPFTATSQNNGYIFKGEFKINRRDFGVGGDNTISDNLTVMLEINASKA